MNPLFPCRGWSRAMPSLLLAAASMAQAQGPSPRVPQADPLDAQAPVPAARYHSPLQAYRRLGDDVRIDWKVANQTVNRLGGWRAYAREAQQPEAAAPPPADRSSPAPAPAPAPTPAHGGHPMHGRDRP